MTQRASGYLPSLDGWRALAVCAVMLAHEPVWVWRGYTNANWKWYGAWGVYVFFAISGLLICTRILEEEAVSGKFDLKAFYLRRIFRIQPAALCYLLVIAVLIGSGMVPELWRFWFGALFLYQNFLHQELNAHFQWRDVYTGHYWTLAVEEHFYILLSLLLFAFRKHRAVLFAFLVLVAYIGRHLATRAGAFDLSVSARRTYWVIPYLLFPSFLAVLLRNRSFHHFTAQYLRPWVVFSGTAALILADRIVRPIPNASFGAVAYLNNEQDWINYTFSFWVVATMTHPKSWTTHLLESPAFRFVGRLSYSLYLWHVLFFVSSWSTVVPVASATLRALSGSPWRYAATVVCALASYYWIEKPFIRLGHKLAPPATPGHADLFVAKRV